MQQQGLCDWQGLWHGAGINNDGNSRASASDAGMHDDGEMALSTGASILVCLANLHPQPEAKAAEQSGFKGVTVHFCWSMALLPTLACAIILSSPPCPARAPLSIRRAWAQDRKVLQRGSRCACRTERSSLSLRCLLSCLSHGHQNRHLRRGVFTSSWGVDDSTILVTRMFSRLGPQIFFL